MLDAKKLNDILDKRGHVVRERNADLINATKDYVDRLRNLKDAIDEATQLARRLYNLTGNRVLAMAEKGNFYKPYLVVLPDEIKIATGGFVDDDPVYYEYKYETFVMGTKRNTLGIDRLWQLVSVGIIEICPYLNDSKNTYRDLANAVIQIVDDWPLLEAELSREIEKLA
jgi:hypothetical protein